MKEKRLTATEILSENYKIGVAMGDAFGGEMLWVKANQKWQPNNMFYGGGNRDMIVAVGSTCMQDELDNPVI